MRDTILDTLFTVLVCLFLVFPTVEVYKNQPDGDLQDNVQDFEIIAHETTKTAQSFFGIN